MASVNEPEGGSPGMVLGGRYQLVKEIARGGMGTVWEGKRLEGPDFPIAIKLMMLPDTPNAHRRFEREVSLAAHLRHSAHVVQVFDYGIDGATRKPYLVMELLKGESLGERLARLGQLPPSEVLLMVQHIGDALSLAHDAGVVHRDLKPDNVYFMTVRGKCLVKLIDFGLAKVFEGEAVEERPLTAERQAIGTLGYMSPEQLGGRVDHRSDLWSLGLIVSECLTGRRVLDARALAEHAAFLLTDKPLPVPSSFGPVPAGFDAWFARATARKPEERFQSATELSNALARVCGTELGLGQTLPVPVDEPRPRRSPLPSAVAVTLTQGPWKLSLLRRHPWLAAGLCGLALVGVTANVYVFRQHRRTTSAPVLVAPAPPAAASASPPAPAPVSVRAVVEQPPAHPAPIEPSAPVPIASDSGEKKPVASADQPVRPPHSSSSKKRHALRKPNAQPAPAPTEIDLGNQVIFLENK